MAKKKKPSRKSARLGRGLSSLMARDGGHTAQNSKKPGARLPTAVPVEMTTEQAVGADASLPSEVAQVQWLELPLEAIRPNPTQPRQAFEESALQRLADSIRQDGLMQPLVVRPATRAKAGVTHEIVAGERRWRAAKLAGLTTLPVVLREADDQKTAELALVENLQREDLNPIERGEAFQRLADKFKLAHEQIAERVGVNRSSITNALRLLDLHEDVKQLVRDGLLSAGQAKALAGISEPKLQRALAVRAIKEDMSVRQVEAAARRTGADAGQGKRSKKAGGRSPHLDDLEKQIAEQLGTKVKIAGGRKKGTGSLTIEFFSLDQFELLLKTLGIKTE